MKRILNVHMCCWIFWKIARRASLGQLVAQTKNERFSRKVCCITLIADSIARALSSGLALLKRRFSPWKFAPRSLTGINFSLVLPIRVEVRRTFSSSRRTTHALALSHWSVRRFRGWQGQFYRTTASGTSIGSRKRFVFSSKKEKTTNHHEIVLLFFRSEQFFTTQLISFVRRERMLHIRVDSSLS